MKRRTITFQGALVLLLLTAGSVATTRAQDAVDEGAPQSLPTLLSIKTSAGWGIGRSRQLYGYNGNAPVYWSIGEGVKLNLALDIPIIPIDVVDSFGATSGTVPVVGLELEAATGYHLSTGGTTNDALSNSVFQETKRTAAFVPVTLGLNARTTFGGGLPSVYIGAGGGVWLTAIYQEDVTNSSAPDQTFSRKMHPPLPFGLYGAIGFEMPLMYDPDAANSMFDLFAEIRMTEMSAYIYDYDVVGAGATTTQSPMSDPTLVTLRDYQRSGSNVSIALGFKFNLY